MKKLIFAGLSFILFLNGCHQQDKLIQSPVRLADMQRMLTVQKQLTANSQVPLWELFDRKLDSDEKQALEFLYAYMPLSDLADYPADFFLANVRQSLKARREIPWISTVPEDVFLHYVLPLRVNNENLDSFRMVMYDEIKDRIQGLSMAEAALEINHWCHEKVNYRGTDSRTSAPLSTVKKTFGRCGEESTFTVSAMRTVGIPARQVYTPRWAHTDDNHAWVEVWINGKWYYMGACEPEPELNMGWFSEPSRRTMLVHTRAYGRYFGNDEVVTAADRFSELNLTRNYAPVKTVTVITKNADGSPADSARVEFKLYNYAEYYPIAIKYSDRNGFSQLTTGMGDLLIWASKTGDFGYAKLSVPETDTLELVLNKTYQPPHVETYDMVPPHAIKTDVRISEAERRENDRRLELEDSLRNAYMKTFKDSIWSSAFARKLNLDRDTVLAFLAKSYGNWQEIVSYLEKNHADYGSNLLALASQLSDKDYSDVSAFILTDHLRNAVNIEDLPREAYRSYVLSPRIHTENLSPWRSYLKGKMGTTGQTAKKDITHLIRWIRENIRIDEQANQHSRAPLTPIGVYNLRVADLISRDIFFVAVCRTFGIPARLNPVTLTPEYFQNNAWSRAYFDDAPASEPLQGFLKLVQTRNPITPQYYIHFTIGVLEDGHYTTLEFDEGRNAKDFQTSVPLDTGSYVLVTGNRLENQSVLSTMTYFTIEPGKLTTVPLELRKTSGALLPSGKLELDKLLVKIQGDARPKNLLTLSGGKGLVIFLLDPGLEPSKHILNDLGPYIDHFNQWGNRFVFVTSPEKSLQDNTYKTYKLPSDHIVGIDVSNNILKVTDTLYGPGLKEKLPLVLLCDKQGNVFLFSAGYKIGIGEQLLKLAH
jgi:hypothetical protein